MRIAKCENGHFFYPEKDSECPRCGTDEYVLIGGKPEKDSEKKPKKEKNVKRKDKNKELDKEIVSSSPVVNSSISDTVTVSEIENANIVDNNETYDDRIFNNINDNNTVLPIEELIGKDINEADVKTSVAVKENDVKTVYYGRTFDEEIEPVTGWLVCIEGENKGKSYIIKSGKNKIGRAAYMDISIEKDMSISKDTHAIIIYEPKNKEFYIIPGINMTYLNDEVVLENRKLVDRDYITIGKSKMVFVQLCSETFSW